MVKKSTKKKSRRKKALPVKKKRPRSLPPVSLSSPESKPRDPSVLPEDADSKNSKVECIENKIRFAREWVRLRSRRLAVDLSGAKCSSNAAKDSTAWRWLQDPVVIAEINRLEKILEKRAIMRAEELDAHVEKLIQANPQELVDAETGEIKDLRDLPRELCYAISEYTTETRIDRRTGEKVVSRKVKLHNKKESAELMYKRKKLLKDQVEHSGSVGLHLAERLAAARKKEREILDRLQAKKDKTDA